MRFILLPLLVVGCFRDVETVFPPGLEPLGEMRVENNNTDDSYLEELQLVAGIDEDIWVHARGYIHSDVPTVWSALQAEEVFVDRRAVSAYSVEWNTEPEYEVSFTVSQTVEDIITVSYDVAYRHGRVGEMNSEDEPEIVSIRFQKVFGTEIIEKMEGSIVLRTVDDGITEFLFQEHMMTPLPDTSDLESYVQDMYSEILLWVRGKALPNYE